jgi:hypothetical protein
VLCLAVDREHAGIVLGYIKSYFAGIPYSKRMVTNETINGLELSNGVDIVVATNDYRSVRGRAVALAILDEVAYWRDDRSVAPDTETYNAIVPGTVTVGGMIIGISSPHRKSGLLSRPASASLSLWASWKLRSKAAEATLSFAKSRSHPERT